MKGVIRLCLLIVMASGTAFAATDEEIQAELDFLFSSIAQSECQFIRNGTTHNPQEAAEHMQRKYDYVKRRVKSTEDFIDLAATKSSITGREYKIACMGRLPIASSVWLNQRLKAYRSN